MSASTPSPLTPTELVDEYFIENRNRLLELAAFLDRIDRAGAGAGGNDFRMQVLREGVAALSSGGADRVHRIQMLLSDPTTEPLPALDRKGAVGAYDRDKDRRR
jgi:hypothetical protein